MSQDVQYRPSDFSTGEDRYIRFIDEVLDTRLSGTQERIISAVTNNQRTLVVSGNGVGKSYAVANLILAFVLTNLDSTVLGTSGSYSQFRDTMWRPLRKTFRNAKKNAVLPGQLRRGNPPRLEIDDDWYAKAVSPRDPGDLEGRHDDHVLIVIEEADKRYITTEHFDSANSSVTDENDRVIAIANPPRDEGNVVYEKMRSERWHVIQFSTFESHNVLVDIGEKSDRIPGLTDLVTIASDYESWNGEPWPETPKDWPGMAEVERRITAGEIPREKAVHVLTPGVEKAEYAHVERDDLDERWYRRRAGVIPPESAGAYRPFTIADVEESYVQRVPGGDTDNIAPDGLGLDVARAGGDWNALAGVFDGEIVVLDRWQGVDHNRNETLVRAHTDGLNITPDFAVDAQGEGSGLADRIRTFYPETVRFSAGSKPLVESQYYDKWAEGLFHLGRFFDEGGIFTNERLREELLAAGRCVEFEEKYYSSRDGEVLKATSKDSIRSQLGRSPDLLDAAYMAVWAAKAESKTGRTRLVW
jgi:hypothetical protein